MSKARPTLLAEVQATRPARSAWDFTPEQLAEIQTVFAAEQRGELRIGCKRLAAMVKARYDLPWSETSIRDHLERLKRGQR